MNVLLQYKNPHKMSPGCAAALQVNHLVTAYHGTPTTNMCHIRLIELRDHISVSHPWIIVVEIYSITPSLKYWRQWPWLRWTPSSTSAANTPPTLSSTGSKSWQQYHDNKGYPRQPARYLLMITQESIAPQPNKLKPDVQVDVVVEPLGSGSSVTQPLAVRTPYSIDD